VEDQIALIGLGVRRSASIERLSWWNILGGYRENAKTVTAEPLVLFLQLDDEDVLHRKQLAIELEVLAAREDRFGRAFADDAVASLVWADDHAHHAAAKIERDFVDLLISGDVEAGVDFASVKDRAVQNIFEPCLKVTVEVGKLKHAVILFEYHIAMPLENDVV